jgi:hypothetical protein
MGDAAGGNVVRGFELEDAVVATIDSASVQARLKYIGVAVVAPERRSAEYLKNW